MIINENFRDVVINCVWRYLDYRDLLKLACTSSDYYKLIENRSTWQYLLARDYRIQLYDKAEHAEVIRSRVEQDYLRSGMKRDEEWIEKKVKWYYDQREDYDLRPNYDPRENYEFMRIVMPEYTTYLSHGGLNLCCSEYRCWEEDCCFRCSLLRNTPDHDCLILSKLKQSVVKYGRNPIKCIVKPNNLEAMLDKNYYDIKSYKRVLKLSGTNIYDIVLQLIIRHARYNKVTITYYVRQMIRIVYCEKYEYSQTMEHYGEFSDSINTFINLLEVLCVQWSGDDGCFKIINTTKLDQYVRGKIVEECRREMIEAAQKRERDKVGPLSM